MWATSLRSTTDIAISDWQVHSRPAGDNADNIIASFCSSSWPSIQLSILSNVSYNLSNVSYNHLKKIVFELEVTVVTERDDSYEVRSSQTGRDSQRYLLAMVYHVEMYSLRTIRFVIALNQSQMLKAVYQYNHNWRMDLNMTMCMHYKMRISWQYLLLEVCNSQRYKILVIFIQCWLKIMIWWR